jgi:hypothetical protein
MSSYFVATRSAKLISRGTKAMRKNPHFCGGLRQDPDFFAFYRPMQPYESGLKGTDTRMVMSPKAGDQAGAQFLWNSYIRRR